MISSEVKHFSTSSKQSCIKLKNHYITIWPFHPKNRSLLFCYCLVTQPQLWHIQTGLFANTGREGQLLPTCVTVPQGEAKPLRRRVNMLEAWGCLTSCNNDTVAYKSLSKRTIMLVRVVVNRPRTHKRKKKKAILVLGKPQALDQRKATQQCNNELITRLLWRLQLGGKEEWRFCVRSKQPRQVYKN